MVQYFLHKKTAKSGLRNSAEFVKLSFSEIQTFAADYLEKFVVRNLFGLLFFSFYIEDLIF